jgi:competence protein ComEC
MYVAIGSTLALLCAIEKFLLFPLLFLYIAFLWKFKRFSRNQILLTLGVLILFFLKGEIEMHNNQTVLAGSEKNFTVSLEHPLKIDGNSFSSYAKDHRTGEKLLLQYTIHTEKDKEALKKLPLGATCKLKGNLEEPDPSRNPNMFDYKEYLAQKHIYWKLKAVHFKANECVENRNLLRAIQNIRQKGIAYIDTYFPKEIAPLTAALIFGDRNLIDKDLNDAYQKLGIVHLLAISGLHVTMLAGFLLYIGLRLQMTRERMTTLLIISLPVYMILTGASPSVNRACIMMMVVLIMAKAVKYHKPVPIDIISTVFIFYVFVEPFVIYDVGFQLSFSVTAALLLSAPILRKYSTRPIFLLVATSTVAQLSSIPILLYYFYEFSSISIVVNILYVPLFSIVILPTLLVVFLLHLLFNNAVQPILLLLEGFIHLLNQATEGLSSIPHNMITLGRPSQIFLMLYGVAIPFCLFKWERAKTRKAELILLFIPLCIMSLQFISARYQVQGEVTVIDVGQGDSILIRLPFNRGTYLIDTGGTLQFPGEPWKERMDPFETGEDVLVPFLKSKGITKLDKLILTHGDMDHIGGAKALLQFVKVKELVLPDTKELSELEKEILAISEAKGIPVRFVSHGDRWRAWDQEFMILSPIHTENMNRNDLSIVLFAELGGLRWLFTGDLEREGEAGLLSSVEPLKVDVLKIGHHGSKSSTSEEFVDSLQPKAALISVGENNRFGHPHQEVLERLKKRRIKIFRTDENGAISFYFKGDHGTFFTQLHNM